MTKLESGMPALDFELYDGEGKLWKLSDLRGKRVILFFYPADDTPGCTAEACDFRDARRDLAEAGYVVLGISPQNAASHQRFSAKYGLNFPLLVDEDRSVAGLYGSAGGTERWNGQVLRVKRSTFVIDEDGNIADAQYRVKARGHVERLRNDLLA